MLYAVYPFLQNTAGGWRTWKLELSALFTAKCKMDTFCCFAGFHKGQSLKHFRLYGKKTNSSSAVKRQEWKLKAICYILRQTCSSIIFFWQSLIQLTRQWGESSWFSKENKVLNLSLTSKVPSQRRSWFIFCSYGGNEYQGNGKQNHIKQSLCGKDYKVGSHLHKLRNATE